MKRNLLYHIYPVNRLAWEWNIRRILSYWDVFNGKKVIVIATDARTESNEVLPYFHGRNAEIILLKNDPHLGETAHFTDLLSHVESRDPNEISFYAHTKGVSYQGDILRRLLVWADSMYTMNLGSPEAIEKILKWKFALGCYKQHIGGHGGSDWHYSGTYFWIRHDALFSRDWKSVHQDKYGVEGYPGRQFRENECEVITPFYSPHDLFYNPPGPDKYNDWLSRLSKDDIPK